MKEKLIAVLLENINLEGIAFALIDDVLETALDELVASTETTFDDMAKAALWAPLEGMIKAAIVKKISDLNN